MATNKSDQILLGQGIDKGTVDEPREQGRLQVQGGCGDLGFYFAGALEKAGTVPLMPAQHLGSPSHSCSSQMGSSVPA